MKVLLDTCVLINLFDRQGNLHDCARQCIDLLLENKCRILVSALSLAEYGAKGNIADILQSKAFTTLTYGVRAAIRAAEFAKLTASDDARQNLRSPENARKVIAIDTQIIAQAACEEADFILTADANTFAKTAEYLKTRGKLPAEVFLLDEDTLATLKGKITPPADPTFFAEDGDEEQGMLFAD